MHRQASYDAFYAGQEAAYNRKPSTANPYLRYDLYEAWKRGWDAEIADQLDHEAAMDRQRARIY